MSFAKSKGPNKGGARRHENNRIYAHPLPLTFSDPSSSRTRSILGLLGLSRSQVINPHCEGYYDASTRSVWVVNQRDSEILWRRGFFGKGNLSRSEPSWFVRQIKDRKSKKVGSNANKMTSEEVREKRRAERKQFKLDRAAAIAKVAAEAETIFETEGRVVVPALFGPEIPSGATWKPKSAESELPLDPESGSPKNAETVEEEEELLEDMEHLQLTLSEAFFLAWNFDCLTILDSETDEPLSLPEIWTTFQQVHLTTPIPILPTPELQFDNPFLVHYAVYHHYRSLGWVVKNGLKFCVDYLLYKRGPVFTHAEFAIVVCPVYEDPQDQESSSINLQNASPFTWSWLSTINRVNSQVMKTLILTYVTIPARCRLSREFLNSPACFAHYSVREVIVRRFIPARMRD
ncbi:tRNA-intron endonuclease [Lentinula aciculospora]|uniref:tRNA-splicing endonuclease subunit Sen2 n=1 Tax=Lentinula aciculospora TaxID=153920 RepID=A0A9W9A8T8_9AGAR|nr:tRNA-intron endonuclease [Lentinula aciculospora]